MRMVNKDGKQVWTLEEGDSIQMEPLERGPRLVIVESPYAGDIKRNTRYARAAVRDCIERGEVPFASHLLYPQVLDEHRPEQRKQGIELGYEVMRRADEVAFYLDFGHSDGMLKAARKAKELGLPVSIRTVFKTHDAETSSSFLTMSKAFDVEMMGGIARTSLAEFCKNDSRFREVDGE